ncbi:uncharacterized protein PG998_013003 [Apiospora kogelbergensis]|uniref:uncharacterized protein n=1 Tax=Apiospora kogelbergensis TaxID=1337665 RepID=UPI00313179B2
MPSTLRRQTRATKETPQFRLQLFTKSVTVPTSLLLLSLTTDLLQFFQASLPAMVKEAWHNAIQSSRRTTATIISCPNDDHQDTSVTLHLPYPINMSLPLQVTTRVVRDIDDAAAGEQASVEGDWSNNDVSDRQADLPSTDWGANTWSPRQDTAPAADQFSDTSNQDQAFANQDWSNQPPVDKQSHAACNADPVPTADQSTEVTADEGFPPTSDFGATTGGWGDAVGGTIAFPVFGSQ